MSVSLPDELMKLYLDELEKEFLAGNKAIIFHAIGFCGNEQIIMPEWVVSAFHSATNDWYSLKAKTLDEAFNCSWPKGKHINAARKKRKNSPIVYSEVMAAKEKGIPIDIHLFEGIALELNINKTDAIIYYSEWKRKMENPGAVRVFDALLEPYKVKYYD
ncbi:hypothetical protein R2083_07185 [Nitrosomonas sp. Is35]|uniref:hypothetical protein n=1 Tax=Nitrosomonas sp. Is35 TaxID=3080534 RepID=UPI00294AA0C3|nr:hypothetical protein [Nitrosomonas sp. Is35]MDV6347299.1 hypothetical protein [Nitrosomonas sp. Is35]